jgi:hypothetical protein
VPSCLVVSHATVRVGCPGCARSHNSWLRPMFTMGVVGQDRTISPLLYSLPSKSESLVRAMFEASATVVVGKGDRALLWTYRWVDDTSISRLAPLVSELVPKQIQRSRTVAQALLNATWISDITGALSVSALVQFVRLWSHLQEVHLEARTPDRFIWKLSRL